MKSISTFALLASLVAASGCQTKNDPAPKQFTDFDSLMRKRGHWEWESSATLGQRLTPASVGFSRQLIFEQDSLVHIYHNQQPEMQPRYYLSHGGIRQCSVPQVAAPVVRYRAEAQIPNNELRTYAIRLASTDTTLLVTGELACLDGGYYEQYRWHSR